VVQEPDGSGKSFYFRVNGRPVFMKGANYIPQDAFLDRVTTERYEHLLQSAADANMNMLRVWGGGIYEKDIFYDLCDEKGILVWQDFMFACSMYPGDEPFLENVRHEAADNVKRLRNHPCIALWCGNNECLSAWYNWGWKRMTEETQGQAVSNIIWKAYEDTYHRILPEVVSQYDPGRFYWSSSPSASMGEPENWVSGDVHYWGVWWGKEPFSTYRTRKCRFMSEYGFQSFPELNTIRKFAVEGDWDIFSEVMKSHQRSSIGNGTIEYYLLQDYRKPKDFPMFLYVGQVLQAEGTRVAMEGHRKNMPYCMGSLFWQIDDCWPVASWSSIDYYGNWKAQQYFAKKAYRDLLISPQIDGDTVSVFVVSDRREDTPAEMKIRLMDFEGNVLWEKSAAIAIRANSSQVPFSSPVSAILPDTVHKDNILLDCRLHAENGQQYSNILYFEPVKNLDLPRPAIDWSLIKKGSGWQLQIQSDKLAKNVFISAGETELTFEDNYFDILPGETVGISILPVKGADIEDPSSRISIISLVDSY
jgi:beta-mannosidase